MRINTFILLIVGAVLLSFFASDSFAIVIGAGCIFAGGILTGMETENKFPRPKTPPSGEKEL